MLAAGRMLQQGPRLKSTKLGLLMFLEKLRLNDKKENVESLDQFLT